MAFKSLEKTFIYSRLNHMGKLNKNIVSIMKDGERLSKSDLEEQFLVIRKNFKYPLKHTILKEVDEGKLQMIYSPADVKMPLSVPFILSRTPKGDVVGMVIIDIFGAKSKDGDSINIDSKKLYTLLESAYFAKLTLFHHKQLPSRAALITNGSSIYASVVIRIFNKKYALNLDRGKMNKVLFLLSKFFLINVLGMTDMEMINNYSIKNCIEPSLHSIQETDSIISDKAYTDIATFIQELTKPELGLNFKNLTVREFLESFIQMYEASMLLFLESLPYFLYNVISVSNGSYLNNQYVLEDLIGNKGAKIYSDLLRLSERS